MYLVRLIHQQDFSRVYIGSDKQPRRDLEQTARGLGIYEWIREVYDRQLALRESRTFTSGSACESLQEGHPLFQVWVLDGTERLLVFLQDLEELLVCIVFSEVSQNWLSIAISTPIQTSIQGLTSITCMYNGEDSEESNAIMLKNASASSSASVNIRGSTITFSPKGA
jgi:hypothetical protein